MLRKTIEIILGALATAVVGFLLARISEQPLTTLIQEHGISTAAGILLFVSGLQWSKNRSLKKKINELTEFTLVDGIYRDYQNNPYCPVAKHVMTNIHPSFGAMEYAYWCTTCEKLFQLPKPATNNLQPPNDDDDDDDDDDDSMMPFSL